MAYAADMEHIKKAPPTGMVSFMFVKYICIVYEVYLSHNKNPNPILIGTRLGFLLFGASGIIGFSLKYSKTEDLYAIFFSLLRRMTQYRRQATFLQSK